MTKLSLFLTVTSIEIHWLYGNFEMIYNISINTKYAVGNIRIAGITLVLIIMKDVMKTSSEKVSLILSKDGFLELTLTTESGVFKAVSEGTMTQDDLDTIKFLNSVE